MFRITVDGSETGVFYLLTTSLDFPNVLDFHAFLDLFFFFPF
jgi:hypothetical protein